MSSCCFTFRLWGYRYINPAIFQRDLDLHALPPGRNGGHLTRNAFSSFLKRQEKFNTSEAVKSYRLEQYTSDALVQFITDRKLAAVVDLVEGGHIGVFRTQEEEQAARKDYEAARAAGVGTGDLGVRWIANEELTNVRSRFHPILLR